MGEGFSTPMQVEKGPEPEIKLSPELLRPTPVESLVAQRWESINKPLEEFR